VRHKLYAQGKLDSAAEDGTMATERNAVTTVNIQ
jgi:hypothetical protein